MLNEARMAIFQRVREKVGPMVGKNLSHHLDYNDAGEPVLEIQAKEPDGNGSCWLFGMMDEPVWGYELEHEYEEGRSWSFVHEKSLGLPEGTDPFTVACAIMEAVETDIIGVLADADSAPKAED